MSNHPLLHAGAGRFWKPPKERSSSSSNVMPSGRYQELRSAQNDTASETFDPLLSRDTISPWHSLSLSSGGDDFEKLGRTPSVGSGSSGASSGSPYGAYGFSAISLPAASSVSLQTPSLGLDRTSSQAYKILSEERKGRLASHIRQLQQIEELRVTHAQHDSGTSSDQKPLGWSESYTNVRSAARSKDGRTSSDSASTHRPSISDAASVDRQRLGRNLKAFEDINRPPGNMKSTASEESLPAALKLPTSGDQAKFAARRKSGPLLHLETPSNELDPANEKKDKKAESAGGPSMDHPRIELNAIKSPTELHAVDAPWSREQRHFELPTTKPTIKRKPYDSIKRASLSGTGRPHSSNSISELPTHMQYSPTLTISPSPERHPEDSSRQPESGASNAPKKERPISATPNPEAFRPTTSAQLLGLIPPQLPRRTKPTPLPTANTFELSTSLSVVHRPRAKSDDRRPRRGVSPSRLEEYNTVLHAPFPLLPRDEEDEATKAEADDAAPSEASAAQEPTSPEKHHRRLDIEEYLGSGGNVSPIVSIEPDIDPRTGRRWVGSMQ